MASVTRFVASEYVKYRKAPTIGKTAIWLAFANWICMVILGIVEISVECKPANTLRCDKWFLDNKSVVLMVSTALQLSNVYNGVIEENFYELIGSFVASLIVSVDCAVMIWAKWPIAKDVQVILLLAVSLVYQIIVLALAMPLYRVLIRRMHRKIGSDPKTQHLYKHHLLTLTLLKFDACFSIITIICAGYGVFNIENGSTGVYRFIAGLFCALVCLSWVAIGWIGMTREKKVLMYIFFVGFVLAPVYSVVWFIYAPYKDNTIGKRVLAINFVIYATITLSIHIAVFIATIVRFNQFGIGLINTLQQEMTRKRREGRNDEGFAHLDSDEEFDLDISFDTNSDVNYQRMDD